MENPSSNLHVLQFRLQQPGLGGAEDAGEVDEETGTAPSCVETLTLARDVTAVLLAVWSHILSKEEDFLFLNSPS